jgi:hypothetical protein
LKDLQGEQGALIFRGIDDCTDQLHRNTFDRGRRTSEVEWLSKTVKSSSLRQAGTNRGDAVLPVQCESTRIAMIASIAQSSCPWMFPGGRTAKRVEYVALFSIFPYLEIINGHVC